MIFESPDDKNYETMFGVLFSYGNGPFLGKFHPKVSRATLTQAVTTLHCPRPQSCTRPTSAQIGSIVSYFLY